jgi:hypothetical protein
MRKSAENAILFLTMQRMRLINQFTCDRQAIRTTLRNEFSTDVRV